MSRLLEVLNLNTRVFFSVIGKPFFRRLILPLSLLLIAVSLLDATTNWAALRENLATRDSWQVTLILTTLILFWGITAGRALRPVWCQPTINFLVRQPIGRWLWVWSLLPSVWIAFLPVVCIWWLAPHNVHPVAHYFGFVGLAWPIILGASFRGFASVKWIATGTVAVATLIFGYAHQPAIAYLGFLVTILLLPLSIAGIRDQLKQSKKTSSGHLVSIKPTIAIVRRDLLCLWRLERKSLLGLVGPGVIAVLMMFALRVNGQVVGRETFVFSCGFLSFAVLPTYEVLTRIKTSLGPELMRQKWPINHWNRGVALLSLMCLLALPIIICLLALGSKMGFAYGLLFILFAATTIVGLTAFFSQTLVVATPMLGWTLWLLFLHTILAVTLPPWIYGAVAAAFVLLGISVTVKGLQKFTYQTEVGALD